MLLAGATAITIRESLFKKLNMPSIREITENKIYLNIDFDNPQYHQEIDGLTIFKEKEEIEMNIDYINLIKKHSLDNNLYSYETNPINISYWKNFKIKGLLVDINKIQEFEQNAL